MHQTRNKTLAYIELGFGCLLLAVVWQLIPMRWWVVDAIGTALAALSLSSAGALLFGSRFAFRMALVASTIQLIVGATAFSATVFTSAHLVGLYGPVGAGGSKLFSAVALLLFPYLLVLPLAKVVFIARSQRHVEQAVAGRS